MRKRKQITVLSEFNNHLITFSYILVVLFFTSSYTSHILVSSFANRLTNIKENHKFQKDGIEGERIEDPAMGIKHIVSEIKDQHSVKYVISGLNYLLIFMIMMYIYNLISSS